MTRSCAIAVVGASLLAFGGAAFAEAKPAELDRAARLVFDQRYEAAARALEQAWRQSGNRRETVLRILELQGVVYAQLGQEAKSLAAFQQLIALDPKRELSGKYSAKVTKPFSGAQAWAADNPSLELTAEAAAVDPNGKVLQIAVKVKSDALKLAKKVRFTSRPDGGKWAEQVVEVQGAYASAGTDADGLEWWAELLGERDMVLLTVGSAKAPVKEGKLKEKEPPKEKTVAVVEKKPPPEEVKKESTAPKKDTPLSEPEPDLSPPDREPEPEVTPRSGDGTSGNAGVRAVGYTALALGMASLVGGTVAGVLWRTTVSDFQGKLDGATREGGVITKLPGVERAPQVYDAMMRERIKTLAIAANVMWSAGAGLAIAGIILYFVGRETIDVAPGAGGLVVAF
ncbi:MAG: hypothetical protein JNK82_20575 [Myxococcaceae bacterium]|nr:hypothetical protein [Myxococcaceae bacterium]